MRRLAATLAGLLILAGCAGQADDGGMADRPAADAPAAGADADARVLADQLARAREGSADYVSDLAGAQSDGYQVITPMVPDMGVHYLNPAVTEFDPARPHALVYVPTRYGMRLGALEWVFPEEPADPPFPGAEYGEFPAACHYLDGTFVPAGAEADCAPVGNDGADFSFWHPLLTTLHVWLWIDNPDGLFAGTNPVVAPLMAHAGGERAE